MGTLLAVIVVTSFGASGCSSAAEQSARTSSRVATRHTIRMPPLDQVTAIAETGNGCQFSLAVLPGARLGGPIDLQLRLTRLTDGREYWLSDDLYPPERRFKVWVLRSGDQIPLTSEGLAVQPRERFRPKVGGGPLAGPRLSETEILHVDLARLFKIVELGAYTVVVSGARPTDRGMTEEVFSTQTLFILSQ